MTTPNEIIHQSLKKSGVLGVGQRALAEDINDAFLDLNDMVAQWQRKRWLVWHLTDNALISTGAQSYTVGPGGQFPFTVRPDRLEAAFFRQLIQSTPNQVDYPLDILEARESYNEIALKQLSSFPMYIFYDPAYPIGRVYPWPIPQASIYEIHITVKELLSSFVTLTQAIILPPEYMAALKFNLARRLRSSYRLPMDPELNALARDALNVLRMANAQVPRLRMPEDILRPGVYNPYSDQIR